MHPWALRMTAAVMQAPEFEADLFIEVLGCVANLDIPGVAQFQL